MVSSAFWPSILFHKMPKNIHTYALKFLARRAQCRHSCKDSRHGEEYKIALTAKRAKSATQLYSGGATQTVSLLRQKNKYYKKEGQKPSQLSVDFKY